MFSRFHDNWFYIGRFSYILSKWPRDKIHNKGDNAASCLLLLYVLKGLEHTLPVIKLAERLKYITLTILTKLDLRPLSFKTSQR